MANEAKHYHRSSEDAVGWNTLCDSATIRMVELMGGHEWIRWRADLFDALWPRRRRALAHNGARSDRQYFKHRAAEEKRAAKNAVGHKARQAHEELATRYDELAKQARKRRDARLDHGLTETFPASDPVSVAHVS